MNKNAILGIIVAVIAVGGLIAYKVFPSQSDINEATTEVAENMELDATEGKDVVQVETAAGDAQEESASVPNPMADGSDFVVEPGNPVVARVDGKDITRVDVYRFIQTMPQNIQQLPASTVYPMAMEQVINTRIVQNKADTADIADSEDFKREMEMAKQQIERNIYLQKEVDSKITEAKIKDAYDDYIKKAPNVEERRARHILVDTEDKAKAIIEKLNTGANFEELAKTLSQGPTAPNGGDLGYFAKTDMIPEFADAAFKMDKNTVLETPVKTQFGWHVIQLVDVRQRPKPTLEQLTPMIVADLRRGVLEDLINNWRKNVKIEQFDINGKPLKPGADATGLVPAEQPQVKQGG